MTTRTRPRALAFARVGMAAVLAHVLGIRLLGSIEDWQRWLHAHAGLFAAWRWCLYGVTSWAWWWVHRRVCLREPDIETRHRLLRIEIAAVGAIVLLEGSAWLRQG